MRKKLKQQRGESLTEALAAILIAALCFAFLCTTIVTAARINKRVRDTDNSFRAEPEPRSIASVKAQTGVCGEIAVTLYETENGYLYYALE